MKIRQKKGREKMKEIIDASNQMLADLAVFYRKLQNYHWNIQGKDFFTIHAKLEEYYDTINEEIDELAEHILMLGDTPLGTMKDYLEITTIAEAKNEKIQSNEVFKNLIEDYGKLLAEAKQIKQLADDNNGYETSSLMDGYMSEYTKTLWMLKQSIAE